MKQIKTTVAPISRLATTLYHFIKKHLVFITGYGSTIMPYLVPKIAYAAGTLPWENVLDTLLASIQGDVAQFCALVSVVVFGIIVAFSEDNGIFRRGIRILIGLSIAGGASLIIGLFGFSGN